MPNSAPRAGENPTRQNKLLEEKDGERLDHRSGGHARPSWSGNSDRGRSRPGLRPRPVRQRCLRTPTKVALGGYCASYCVRYGSKKSRLDIAGSPLPQDDCDEGENNSTDRFCRCCGDHYGWRNERARRRKT